MNRRERQFVTNELDKVTENISKNLCRDGIGFIYCVYDEKDDHLTVNTTLTKEATIELIKELSNYCHN